MILISHFYNEELFLPYWLRHHKKIFKKGILINNNSSDNSVNIINEIAPDWEILNSPSKEYKAEEMNTFIEGIESKFKNDLKIVLNTTEFLMIEDFENFFEITKNPNTKFWVSTALMVDKYPETIVKNDLINQKNFGIWHDQLNVFRLNKKFALGKVSRARLLHNLPKGEYLPGRHLSYIKNIKRISPKVAYIRWYYYSPWNNKFIERKLNVSKNLSQDDLKKGYGSGHFHDKESYIKTQKYLIKKSYPIPSYNFLIFMKIKIVLIFRTFSDILFVLKYSKTLRNFFKLLVPSKKIRIKVSSLLFKKRT
jgi:hypothetical protein